MDAIPESDSIYTCPYCGQVNDIDVDPSEGPQQQFVEDCRVCCRPIVVTVRFLESSRTFAVEAAPENQ
ncbi:MAG TPA: CPXCG motif-containing cysteine-rich protein [candidate division Zixibacteria bacterium]|jgi:hypothetical protein